ncbi:MAG: Hpt domain-containing protein [Calditrichaeota bacterium]|nr:Hpt domain-containing protein [Calditrichota bacterium]
MGNKVIDLETALDRLGGDKEFLLELLGELVQQIDQSLPDLKNAVDSANYDELRSIAHGLKGAAANLGADKIAEQFLQLEMMGKEHRLNGAIEGVENARELNEELKNYITTL